MSDDTFAQLVSCRGGLIAQSLIIHVQADGKQNAQKLFMTGGLKVKGNIMLAVSILPKVRAVLTIVQTKLDSLLKTAKAKL